MARSIGKLECFVTSDLEEGSNRDLEERRMVDFEGEIAI